MNKNKGKGQHIKVYVRVRPLNEAESRRRSSVIVDCASNNEIIVNERPLDRITKKFTFDKVFGPSSKQADVYKSVACPLIKEVLDGYNCTIFAYGQTGTGKTYTMEGAKWENQSMTWRADTDAGIIPRALSHLFDELRLMKVEYSMKASFLEIYNEELFDLLSPVDDTNKIRLFEDNLRKGAVIVSGLDEVAVQNKEEVYTLLARGSRKRQTAATLMNAVSSRSHTVFSVVVRLKEDGVGDEILRTGKLNLVDLAGSENIGRSGAVEKRAREAGNINQSLLTLGRVITALVEKTPHIPYRESKLTRLLQESLGGRTKTCIIATVSPSQCNMEETLSTLDYAHRAKNIQNKPEVNEKIGKAALIQEYMEEIHRLKSDLTATREKNGVWLAEDNYNGMILQIESQEKELSDMLVNMRTVTEALERKEEMNKQLSEALQKYLEDLDKTKSTLHKTKEERDEQKFLLQHHIQTEQQLSKQAKSLLSVADKAANHTFLLHNALDRKRSIEENNVMKCRNIANVCQQKLSDFRERSSSYLESGIKSNNELIQILDRGNMQTQASAEEMKEGIDYAQKARKDITKKIQDLNESLALQTTTTVDVVISENIQSFKHHLKSLEVFLAEMICKFEVALNAANRSRIETEAFTSSLSSKAEEQKTLMCQCLSLSNEQLNIVSEGIKKQEKFLLDLNATVQDMMTREALNDENIKIASEALEKIRNNAEGRKSVVQTISSSLANTNLPRSELEDCICNVECMKQTMENYSSNMQTSINEQNMKLSPITNEIEQLCSEGSRLIEEQMSTFPALQNKHLENISAHMNSVTANTSWFNCQLEFHVDELDRHGCEFDDSQKKNIDRGLEEQLKVVQECKSHVEKDSECRQAWNQDVAEKTDECERVLVKGVTDEIHVDVPSGRTPQRCEYNYPQNLVTTSPHERILSRFRTVHMKSPLALSNTSDSSSQENLLTVNCSKELSEAEPTSLPVQEFPSLNELDVPCVILDKENSALSSSITSTKLKVSERHVLSERN